MGLHWADVDRIEGLDSFDTERGAVASGQEHVWKLPSTCCAVSTTGRGRRRHMRWPQLVQRHSPLAFCR
jgi:hypothetical protein